MSEHKYLRPGLTVSRYPQQMDAWPGVLEALMRRIVANIKYQFQRRKYRPSYIIKKLKPYEQGIEQLSDDELKEQVHQIKRKLLQFGLQDKLTFQSFAIIREVAHRALGLRHFDVQVLGGWVMINGMIAEMETGQGKTLTATLPACTAALAGIPVHVVTANDYLAERDEEIMRPLYSWLGISSASVVGGMEIEPRIEAYKCGIVHSTSQQICFDYLRDRMEMGEDFGKMQIQFKQIQSEQQQKPSPFLLRGLCYTIIDEADSLLIDEAKTPLIISHTRQNEEQDKIYFDALYLGSLLKKKTDFTIDSPQEIKLTPAGKTKLEDHCTSMDSYWHRRRQREFMAVLALRANHSFQRDVDYLVRDDKVEIIDPLTGRSMPDRSWEQGLHQLVEAKEGCEITGERDALAKISYQKFFKRYLHVAGMSGTVSDVADELNSVYGLRVQKIPTHTPSSRIMLPELVYKDLAQKWQCFIENIESLHQLGRPILIGTKTVADSETVSALLSEHKLAHQVLNAQKDDQEAEIVAQAGQLKRITVATNMAGRGTDISLGDGVEELGGLHVINTDRNDARRIDLQLYGRCARQGDPGSAEAYLSLQDENVAKYFPAFMIRLFSSLTSKNKPLPSWLAKIVMTLPQKRIENNNSSIRHFLMKQDKNQAKMLSFTGRME